MGENVCISHIWWTVSRKYEELYIQQQYQKDKQLYYNWVRNLNTHFSKEDIKMVNSHGKGFLTSLVTKETQGQTTVRFHFTTAAMSAVQKTGSDKCREGCKGLEPSYTVGGKVKGVSYFGRQFLVPQNVEHRITLHSTNSIMWYVPKRIWNICTQKRVHEC